MSYVDHRMPADALIGDLGRGLNQILSVMETGRINIAARAVGVARAAFDAALAYAQQRVTMGKPIAEHQAIQLKLADMATKIEAARLLTQNAAERKEAGLRCDVEAGMAKLFASETALEVATESMRIHGGVGYTTELPVERYFRDAPADDHRRGHQRDPAHRDRARSARARASSRRPQARCFRRNAAASAIASFAGGHDLAHPEEAVDHAVVANDLRVDVGGVEERGVVLALVAQGVELGGEDERGREPAEVGGLVDGERTCRSGSPPGPT